MADIVNKAAPANMSVEDVKATIVSPGRSGVLQEASGPNDKLGLGSAIGPWAQMGFGGIVAGILVMFLIWDHNSREADRAERKELAKEQKETDKEDKAERKVERKEWTDAINKLAEANREMANANRLLVAEIRGKGLISQGTFNKLPNVMQAPPNASPMPAMPPVPNKGD